jgi:hypothetical protein
MPVMASDIRFDSPQADGRRYITEVHTDSLGREHAFTWLAEPSQDASEGLAARAIQVNTELVLNEVADCIALLKSGNDPQTFVWIEQQQVAGIRAAFRRFVFAELPGITLDELEAVCPILGTYHADVFGPLVGLTVETAQSIIDWARQTVATYQVLGEVLAAAAGEIGT